MLNAPTLSDDRMSDCATDLLTRAQRGNHSELGELLDSFRPILLHIASLKLTNQLRRRVSESDIVQQTMLTASCSFRSFRGTTDAEFSNWLIRVLESRLADAFRQHTVATRRAVSLEVHAVDQLADSHESPSAVARTHEDAARLMQAILQLAHPARDIVLLRYMEQETFDAIATKLLMSVPTVWRHWSRALERLRDDLYHHDAIAHCDGEFCCSVRDSSVRENG